MIKIVEKDLFESKANFIVHQVNCMGVMGSGVAAQVAALYPHVEKEYRKYLKYCKKYKINPLGTVQYVPDETWALPMADTMKNNRVEIFDDFRYIVNMFGQEEYGSGVQTNLTAVKRAFVDIYNKAKESGATIAMPYKIGSCRGGADWNDVYNIIKEVFIDVDVEICKRDLG